MTLSELLTKCMQYHKLKTSPQVVSEIVKGQLSDEPEDSVWRWNYRRALDLCGTLWSMDPIFQPSLHTIVSLLNNFHTTKGNHLQCSICAAGKLGTCASVQDCAKKRCSRTIYKQFKKLSDAINWWSEVRSDVINRQRMKVRSDEIDRQIEEDSQKFRKECKILLLGSRESGGSTIVKQMKIMHQNGYTREELSAYRLTVYQNLLESAQAIVLAMRELAIDPVLPANRAYIDTILVYKVDPPSSITAASSSVAGANTATATGEFSEEVAAAIDALWSDPIIPKIMDHSSEFYSMNSASYFLSEVRRIGKPGYVPTETDVLHARQKLTGIVETRFNMGQLSIRIVDVCGQRGERRKWIHCFEHVTSIIFCPALSEYDQVLLEESCRTRMVDSLVLFESVINSRWFLRTSIMLFLTEIDVFKSKLLKVPLERYFPEYTGGADIDKAVKYILWRFMQANRARLCIYPHLIQGTDMGNIRLVFAVVKETILHNALKDAGIL